MRHFIFLIIAFTAFTSHADIESEKQQWYLAENGLHLIRDSYNDGYFANLGFSKAGNLNIYIMYWDNKKCSQSSNENQYHEPLYVNEKLVKYTQSCNGSWRTFFPITHAGREYLISEFKNKNIVEITTYNKQFKMLYSANGFTKIYNEKVAIENAKLTAL